MFNIKHGNIKIEYIYLVLSLVFGLAIVFLNGPFQAPDEYNHFYRAYQISEGHLVCEHYKNENGAYVPRSLKESSEIKYSENVPFHTEKKFQIKSIVSALDTKLIPEKQMFVAIPNTAAYAPVVYIPQSLGIFIGRTLNLSPLILMYLGRIMNLIFSTIMIYFAMKNVPNKKLLLLVLGLMPMLLYEAASLSADGVTNCMAIFGITYFIKLLGSKYKKLSRNQIIKMFLIIVFISLTKQIYFLFSFMFFIIPKEKFKSNKEYYALGIGMLLLSIFMNLFWMKVSGTINVLSTSRNASPKDQIIYVIMHPFAFMETIFRTLWVNGNIYYNSFIGTLGWLDTVLPKEIIYSYTVMLIIAAMVNDSDETFSPRNKIKLISLFLIMFGAVIVALYVTFTGVGKNTVSGVQGRYFIPPALLLLSTLDVKRLKIKYFDIFCVIYLIFTLTATLYVLMNRYYLI